jgi:hypothetical protein
VLGGGLGRQLGQGTLVHEQRWDSDRWMGLVSMFCEP